MKNSFIVENLIHATMIFTSEVIQAMQIKFEYFFSRLTELCKYKFSCVIFVFVFDKNLLLPAKIVACLAGACPNDA